MMKKQRAPNLLRYNHKISNTLIDTSRQTDIRVFYHHDPIVNVSIFLDDPIKKKNFFIIIFNYMISHHPCPIDSYKLYTKAV